jgi:alkylation response protein AidB-like acyl-CoA dehydrogenase
VDFRLSEEQELFVKGVRDFARSEIAPLCAKMDEAGGIDAALLQRIRAQGYFGLCFPERYGGLGLSTLSYGLVIRELARVDPGIAIMISVHNGVGSTPLMQFGSEELRREILPQMAAGSIASFCVTEPGAGSDAASLRARAERSPTGYRLSGEKIWVTNGHLADHFVVTARLAEPPGPRGICAFLLPRNAAGLSIGAKEDKMGLRSSDAVSLVLDGVEVPRQRLLGQEGDGFKIVMQALDGGRIGVAYQSLGVAEAALELGARYALEREQFGKPIADKQAIQWMLADTATELEQATLLAHKAAWLKDEGLPYAKEAAMAKLAASEMAGRAVDRALQIHGGYGFSKDYPIERYYRDARVLRIYEGTSEIQRLVIARAVLSEFPGRH